MTPKHLSMLASVLFVLTPVAPADMIVDLLDVHGNDSGWSVLLPNDVLYGIVVDRVTDDYVRIEILKTFADPPVGGAFMPNLIGFQQRLADSGTSGTIQITDEIIRNATGAAWTDYHWDVLGPAAFGRAATEASGFTVGPFTTMIWGLPPPGWDADHAGSLDVDGGVVVDAAIYTPGLAGGKLVIDVDLASDDGDFWLRQEPTPEPGALALVAPAALRRRSP